MPVKQLLIFDSGVGGLSIFQEVIKRVTNINCYYLSDNAYFPYGELDEIALISRLTELLQRFVKKYPVDMIVIACNSASTVALTALRALFTIPIVGVVPAIKPANLMTANGIIGLVATPATINREYTQKLVEQFAADKAVLKLGSTELVKLAEEKLQGQAIDRKRINHVFDAWLKLNIKPDTLVLGCTHFPLLKPEISACFDNQVKLVDSGEAIANRVVDLLGVEQQVEKIKPKVRYDAFYTLADEKQLLLKSTFLKLDFKSFLLFKA